MIRPASRGTAKDSNHTSRARAAVIRVKYDISNSKDQRTTKDVDQLVACKKNERHPEMSVQIQHPVSCFAIGGHRCEGPAPGF
jgi:hypothetical protein